MSPAAVEIVVEQLRREVPGGIGTYCRGLLQGLSETQAEKHVPSLPTVRLRASRPPRRPDPLRAFGFPVVTSRLPAPALTALWGAGIPVGFLRPPASLRGALVHATSFTAPVPHGRPFTIMVHDLAFRRLPAAYPARGREWHERALRRLAAAADVLIVPSELTASDLLAGGLGITEGRVYVIPEGADHLPEPDEAAAATVLGRLGLPRAVPYLLSVCTLEPRKNLARLLEAYAVARDRLPEPWPLVVVGPRGWGDSGLSDGGGEGVLLAGHVEDPALAALYLGARAMCYVPLVEGFGLPVAEAMRAGTPVVASHGLPSSNGAALEVDPLDPESIAEGIVSAATDSVVRDRLVTAGRARASSLTWAAAASAHLEVWRTVAA